MGFLDFLGFSSGTRPLTAAPTAPMASARSARQALESSPRGTSEAWRVWRCVGEVHYVTTQQARLMSRVKWDIEIGGRLLEPDQSTEMVTAAFGRGFTELVRQAALHLQVAGGYYLARFPYARGPEWEVLPIPLALDARKHDKPEPDILIKIINPDPVNSDQPDSAVISSLDVSRELMLARAQARVAARNRTAQLQTVIYPLEGAGPDTEQFEADLIDVITAPIEDELSSASVVPNVVGFQGEWIDKWKTIDLTGPIDEKLNVKIEGLVRQLAVVLDIPPEILTGMSEGNHWTSWLIQEDNWLGHVEPMAKTVGHGFAEALAAAADMDPASVDMLPDPSPLLQRRPTVGDAMAAFDSGLVSADWAREQLGADEDDAAEVDGRLNPTVQTALDMVRAAPSLAQTPGLPALVAQLREIIEGGPPAPVPEAVDAPAQRRSIDAAEPEATEEPSVAAAPALPFSTDRLLGIDEQATDAVGDLLESAVLRATEKVGGKLRAQLQGSPEDKARYADVPNAELPAQLGTDRLPGLDDTVAAAVADAVSSYGRIIDRAYRYTRAAGVDVRPDRAAVEDSAELLRTEAAQIALAAMRGEPTAAYVWALTQRVLTIAGGGTDPAPAAEVAAPRRIPMPDPLNVAGIATGRTAVQWIIDHVGVVPSQYRWEHVGGSGDDHPEHVDLDGELFDGESIYRDGVVWFPGDHSGCRCRRVPVWEETTS